MVKNKKKKSRDSIKERMEAMQASIDILERRSKAFGQVHMDLLSRADLNCLLEAAEEKNTKILGLVIQKEFDRKPTRLTLTMDHGWLRWSELNTEERDKK